MGKFIEMYRKKYDDLNLTFIQNSFDPKAIEKILQNKVKDSKIIEFIDKFYQKVSHPEIHVVERVNISRSDTNKKIIKSISSSNDDKIKINDKIKIHTEFLKWEDFKKAFEIVEKKLIGEKFKDILKNKEKILEEEIEIDLGKDNKIEAFAFNPAQYKLRIYKTSKVIVRLFIDTLGKKVEIRTMYPKAP